MTWSQASWRPRTCWVLEPAHRPGRVFDLELPLEEAAEAYQAMDERRAIKALLHPLTNQ
jgi:hypothetical protein